MINLEKFMLEIENVEDKTNEEEEIIRSLLEYASYPTKEIDYNFFKDIPSELIMKAIEEVNKLNKNQKSEILSDMITLQYIKENVEGFIPKLELDDEDFF